MLHACKSNIKSVDEEHVSPEKYLHFAGQCNDHDEIGIVVPIGARKKVF